VEEVHVKFPKFKVDYSLELAEKLKQVRTFFYKWFNLGTK